MRSCPGWHAKRSTRHRIPISIDISSGWGWWTLRTLADRDLAQPVPAPVESGVTVQLLERRLRRAEISVAVLGIIVVVLALIEVIQLLR